MSIKVGVRVRPFNKREEQLKCRLCVDMDTTNTILTDGDGNQKTFTYDYSFWSHDGFRTDQNGINIPTNDKYADQKKVYNQIGQSILDNAWQGYNCCLFAYGQTGSGKSYSMIGYGNNKGIIPIVCDEIFKKIQQTKQNNKSYEVTVSMMEIYNESVRDLLSKKHDTDLKICQHKKYGVYVQGLIKHPVHSFLEIQRKIQQGSNNRSIAATLMNESSSRSHTIVSINFTQQLQVSKAQMSMKYSVIHLVDLAGSQCVAKTGAISRDRLRQTAKINQSLSTLGRVIETLAQNSSKSEKIYVPYRDSKLTFILRNALGGNSQTAMICAISPADDNIQQTLSTLRYASRAKKIQNKAIVNESDVDKLIRQLREQNEMLKKLLQEARKNKMSSASIDEMNLINQGVASMGLEQIEQQENLLDDSNDSKTKKVEQIPQEKVEDNSPHITNISQDQLLSKRLKYNIKQQLTIGNKEGSPKPDVVLGALGIQALHAKIFKEGDQYFIMPMDETASDYLYLNGENVLKKTKIYNLDRIVLGTGCVFLFKQIGKQPRKAIQQNQIDYQMSISELSSIPGNKSIIEQGQLRQQILKQIETQYEKTKQQNQQKLRQEIEKQQQLYRQKLRQIEQQKANETIKLKQQLEVKSNQARLLEEEKKKADEEVQKYLKLEQQLQKSHLQKVVYEQTRQILQQKLEKVKELQMKVEQTKKKQEQMKHEIQKKQQSIRKQLQIKTIMCQNENIMNDYKLQLNKKSKDAKELRDYFIKKQKIELQKQLVELVPMIQKFNLMAKDMKKRVEGILSVKYKYISDTEIAEVLKSGSYKGKFKIQFRIKNKQEGRSYYWNADIFKNRYQLAQEQFDIFIADPTNPRLNDKNADPYWDPPQFQTKGFGYLLVQCIFYNLSFEGKVNIVYCGQVVGQFNVKLYPCDPDGTQTTMNYSGMQLRSPRELIDKTIHFGLIMSHLKLFHPFKKILMEYELFGNSYKKNIFRTQQSSPQAFYYEKIHTFKDISEMLLLHHCQKPLQIQLKAYPQPDKLLQIKSLNSSFASKKDEDQTEEMTSQQIIQLDVKQFTDISPPKIGKRGVSGQKAIVFDNTQVLQKIQRDYNNKKSLIQKKRQKEKQWKQSNTKKSKVGDKQKQCIIY